MKKLVLIFYLTSFYTFAQLQTVTYSIDPASFNEDNQIAITFNGSSIDESAWGVSDNSLYLWAWSLDLNGANSQDSPTNGEWSNSDEANKLTYNSGDDTYNITFTPTTFYNRTGIGTIGFLIKAKDGSGDKKSQDILVSVGTIDPPPVITEAPVPNGMLDGINYHASDNTKVTLVLYAPGKDYVNLIGDFNDWQRDDTNYLLFKDSTNDRFWIELTGLTPQFNHMYQYLVDGTIRIADPYSTTILDESNDNSIDNITYPNLTAYPVDKTSHAVTLLRTGDAQYNWQVSNFTPPPKTDLVIYELLIRDFDALHSFDAVKSRLDYLQTLGVNAIELMPVSEFDGNESWGYNPSFHMALDKYYGTPTAFKELIDECHNRGIAVILDVVYNHATGQNPYFRMWNTSNGAYTGQATAENPFFNVEPKHSYNVFNDFNHSTQATKDYVKRTVEYWIEEYKIDGFRWDLTKGFTQNCSASDENCTGIYQPDRVAVLKEYADHQWASDDDFYVIFEHLGTNEEETEWVNYRLNEGKGIMVWGNHNFNYNEATMGYHDSEKSDFSWISYLERGWSVPANVSYMESHDEERLMFKNLEYGNSSGNYNIKDLDTALDRMELAGAFYFTVPGPKMIWQFGELGYDYSIDYNGRVGNKPIRWDYFDDTNRKSLYNLWAQLIELKLNIPIFRTSDFSLDVANSNGLKKIQLTLNSAAADEIKHITVLGNFGVTTQSMTPSFQETGTWYSLLENNKISEVTNTSSPISLEPGVFKIYANNPYIDPDDLDSDGVPNVDDKCPNTEFGTTVDVDGCAIFTLPSNNYTIMTTSETCRTANDGKISVIVANNLNYTISITGPNAFSLVENFNTDWSTVNLLAGSYTACFTVENEPNYEQCFDLIITEPEDLSVLSDVKRDSQEISLKLDGSDVYFITLNGITQETSENQITLKLNSGNNNLKITTGIECQGIYKKNIFLSDNVVLFPNPIKSVLHIYTNSFDKQVGVKIFQAQGKLILNKKISISQDGLINIPLSYLQSGLYFIQIQGNSTNDTLKFIKQ